MFHIKISHSLKLVHNYYQLHYFYFCHIFYTINTIKVITNILLFNVDTVERFGPLYVSTCFPFENLNGLLKSLVKGNNHPELQVYSSYTLFSQYTHLRDNLLISDSEVLNFCENMMKRSKRRRKISIVQDNIYIVGTSHHLKSVNDNIKEALGPLLTVNSEVSLFQRLFKDGIVYESQIYCENKKTNSSCVEYEANRTNKIGIIYYFIKLDDVIKNTSKIYAIVKKCASLKAFKCNYTKSFVTTTFLCAEMLAEKLHVVEVNNLNSVCFNVNVDTSMFAVKPVNLIELE